ncbi:hypothetical protein Ddc_03100 [Ditylenchus destructor]|nr:hypothetical protein Ddc_03100 [Ditylenchus destructor]
MDENIMPSPMNCKVFNGVPNKSERQNADDIYCEENETFDMSLTLLEFEKRFENKLQQEFRLLTQQLSEKLAGVEQKCVYLSEDLDRHKWLIQNADKKLSDQTGYIKELCREMSLVRSAIENPLTRPSSANERVNENSVDARPYVNRHADFAPRTDLEFGNRRSHNVQRNGYDNWERLSNNGYENSIDSFSKRGNRSGGYNNLNNYRGESPGKGWWDNENNATRSAYFREGQSFGSRHADGSNGEEWSRLRSFNDDQSQSGRSSFVPNRNRITTFGLGGNLKYSNEECSEDYGVPRRNVSDIPANGLNFRGTTFRGNRRGRPFRGKNVSNGLRHYNDYKRDIPDDAISSGQYGHPDCSMNEDAVSSDMLYSPGGFGRSFVENSSHGNFGSGNIAERYESGNTFDRPSVERSLGIVEDSTSWFSKTAEQSSSNGQCSVNLKKTKGDPDAFADNKDSCNNQADFKKTNEESKCESDQTTVHVPKPQLIGGFGTRRRLNFDTRTRQGNLHLVNNCATNTENSSKSDAESRVPIPIADDANNSAQLSSMHNEEENMTLDVDLLATSRNEQTNYISESNTEMSNEDQSSNSEDASEDLSDEKAFDELVDELIDATSHQCTVSNDAAMQETNTDDIISETLSEILNCVNTSLVSTDAVDHNAAL